MKGHFHVVITQLQLFSCSVKNMWQRWWQSVLIFSITAPSWLRAFHYIQWNYSVTAKNVPFVGQRHAASFSQTWFTNVRACTPLTLVWSNGAPLWQQPYFISKSWKSRIGRFKNKNSSNCSLVLLCKQYAVMQKVLLKKNTSFVNITVILESMSRSRMTRIAFFPIK